MLNDDRQFADVLIVCGQGVYGDGVFYGKYHDREVFLAHAIEVPNIKEKYGYTHVVTSGGFTQKERPTLSESTSFDRIYPK